MSYEFNPDTNTVLAIINSDEALAKTKPTWTLSKDRLKYSKIYNTNSTYHTQVQDIWGNSTEVEINITQIDVTGPEITVEQELNEDNTVTVTMKSNEKMKNTKPTWTLSEDKLSYSKTYVANGKYKTPVSDLWGNITNVEISVTKVDNKGPEITVEQELNEDNTVTVTMKSNEKMKDTKPTWTLSEDKLSYSKVYNTNSKYFTQVQDIWGNMTNVDISITQIDDKGPVITVNKIVNNDNTVTLVMNSNEIMKDTKPSWILSEDKLSYSKIYTANGNYRTPVYDIWGNETNVEIKVNEIDDKAPEISLEYILNDDLTITIIMKSNEELGDTKPTWTLSEDRRSYSKIFDSEQDYMTSVYDIWGNERLVKIFYKNKEYTYNNNGFDLRVKYVYDINDIVTVYIISNRQLKNTKPSWILNETKMIYKKAFTSNQIYSTQVEDVYGNTATVSIIVDFYKSSFRGIDVSEYQKIINWQAVKNSGIDFAIIRVGYRGWGQNGTLVTDRFFDRNIVEATRVGMNIGFYFYSQAVNVNEAIEEARYTVNNIQRYNVPIKYPIVIDTERTPVGTGRADGLTTGQRTEVVRAFCEEIRRLGYTPMIYANKNWLLNNINIQSLNSYDVWLAHYTSATDYKYPYTIWQYTSSGTVNGIVGNTDMDIGYKRY